MACQRKEVIFLVLASVFALFLFFSNLGNIYLWQDEAQTALISKTVLKFGVPKGFDGTNFFSQELGAEYGKDYVWKWHTWFPFYLLAGCFKIFGISTFTARLPFAIFGVGCLFLTYFFSKSLWKSQKAALFTLWLLLFSIPFLILSRQCRYYSLTAFFSVAFMYSYYLILQNKRSGPVLFLLSCLFLFHTHYVYLATAMCTIAVHSVLFHRDQWKPIWLWSGIGIILNLPWVIWLSGMKYGEQYSAKIFNWSSFIYKLIGFVHLVHEHIFSFFILLVPILVGLWCLFKKKEDEPFWKNKELISNFSLPVLFILITMVALSLTAPAPFFRYLAPLIPFFFMIMGILFALAGRIHVVVGVLLVIGVILLGPVKPYLYEITHDFNGPIEGIVKYLNEHAHKDGTVAITYGDLPIKFYTGLRVFGGLTGEDLTPAVDADWIILRRNIICSKDYNVRTFLIKHVNGNNYDRHELAYPDTPFENRESPNEHLFKTATNYPPVVLFQKRK